MSLQNVYTSELAGADSGIARIYLTVPMNYGYDEFPFSNRSPSKTKEWDVETLIKQYTSNFWFELPLTNNDFKINTTYNNDTGFYRTVIAGNILGYTDDLAEKLRKYAVSGCYAIVRMFNGNDYFIGDYNQMAELSFETETSELKRGDRFCSIKISFNGIDEPAKFMQSELF